MITTDQTLTTETAAAGAAEETTATATGEQQAGPSWDDEIMGAVNAAAAKASGEQGQAPAPSEDPKPDGEKPAEEKPAQASNEEEKQEEPPKAEEKKPDRMADRLALIAKGQRDLELGRRDLEAERAKLKPDLERLDKIRQAPNRVAMSRELYGGEEGLREFYVELTDYIHGDGAEPAPADKRSSDKPLTASQVDQVVAAKVKEALAVADAERKTQQQTIVAEAKAEYARLALSRLEDLGDRFPHVYAAPPAERVITTISDEILASTGQVPDVETVLEKIEDHRRERYQKKQKKPADQTTAATKPNAAPARANETSGGKSATQPIGR